MSRTPSLGSLPARIRLAVNLRLPDKPVRRTVRGVQMLLPRRHALPYFTRPGTPYYDNMVQLGTLLAEREGEVCMLDVGANVGDSALFFLDDVPGSVVCVEPDPAWYEYLQANVGAMGNVAVEHSVLLGPDAVGSTLAMVHADVGSSIVERVDGGGAGLPTITTDVLLAKYPQLANVRLIKSDTDGYDVMLVPAYLRTFRASTPIIFFEFDPRPTSVTTPELDPYAIWSDLTDAGYENALVWDNGGKLLGAWPTSELLERSEILRLTKKERGYGFWDVAVAHRDDGVGLDVLAAIARTRPAIPQQRAGE